MLWCFPLTPGPSPRWGEGKVNIKFNSLAPAGGEGARRAGEGVIRIVSQLQRCRGSLCREPDGTFQRDTPAAQGLLPPSQGFSGEDFTSQSDRRANLKLKYFVQVFSSLFRTGWNSQF